MVDEVFGGVWSFEEEVSSRMVASTELVGGKGMDEEWDECLGRNKIY